MQAEVMLASVQIWSSQDWWSGSTNCSWICGTIPKISLVWKSTLKKSKN